MKLLQKSKPLLRRRLLAWYDRHARDLPWRRTSDPYAIWVSEIMLQQTRVAAVLDHYRAFLRRFPTVEALASAGEAEVLAIWSGLGYYRRARMLHAAARKVVNELAGEIPGTSAGLQELPGIGRYTAAAIGSIAFGERTAVVDGNVERVLERLAGRRLKREQNWRTANDLISSRRPGDFNQAMMELGATVCLPKAPLCLTCPLQRLCAAQGGLPDAPKSPRQKKREIHYLLHVSRDKVFLTQRPGSASLMPGMWELPELRHVNGVGAPSFTLRHSITVTDYIVRVWRRTGPRSKGSRVKLSQLKEMPLTGLARKVLHKAELL